MKTLELQSCEKECHDGKSYQEAAVTSLPGMISLTWVDVHILFMLQSSVQMLPLPQSLG